MWTENIYNLCITFLLHFFRGKLIYYMHPLIIINHIHCLEKANMRKKVSVNVIENDH